MCEVMPRTGWNTWLGTKDCAEPQATLTAYLQLTCHWSCAKMTRRQNYLLLRNNLSKYTIKVHSKCCHLFLLIAAHFTAGIVKYFEQPVKIKENERIKKKLAGETYFRFTYAVFVYGRTH